MKDETFIPNIDICIIFYIFIITILNEWRIEPNVNIQIGNTYSAKNSTILFLKMC